VTPPHNGAVSAILLTASAAMTNMAAITAGERGPEREPARDCAQGERAAERENEPIDDPRMATTRGGDVVERQHQLGDHRPVGGQRGGGDHRPPDRRQRARVRVIGEPRRPVPERADRE
jgi:hypothetical protein